MKTSFLGPEDIAAGEKALAEIGERNRRKAVLQVNGGDSLSDAWNAPDWSILDDRRGELPDFPAELMPGKEIVALCAHGAGVTFDHVAVPLLAIASGVIGTARRVKAARSWTAPAALWAAVVGLSGTGKTPGINVAKKGTGRGRAQQAGVH